MNVTTTDTKVKAWTPTTSCKIPDNIISSQFTTKKVFVPSYEKEKRPCIEQLLTNEYQRIWWQEKESWDKRHSRKVTTKTLLQRMIIRRKPPPTTTTTTTTTTTSVPDKPKKIRKPEKKRESKTEKTIEKPLKKDKQVEITATRVTTKQETDNKCDETK